MSILNAIKLGIIVVLVFCTANYLLPNPDGVLMQTIYGALVGCVAIILAFFILGKESFKK
ncbi:hypothetical protein [Staphylococcus casei]|uniref:LapA family protein n=1 Tax=Staphylococcus casei TaxID=201828 RepID=A0ABZ2WBR5_9STAP